MKLTYFQLEPHLKQNLASLYVVNGAEPLLKHEAIRLIRRAAKRKGFEERVRLTVQSEGEYEQLYSTLYSNSLFAEKCFIELDCQENTLLQRVGNLLKDYIAHPLPEHCLLLNVGQMDGRLAKSSWYDTLEKKAVVVTIKALTREQLPSWIVQRAKRYQLTLTPEAAQCLADYTEGHVAAAAGAIEKIVLLKPTTTIDVDFIKTTMVEDGRFTPFHFVEQLVEGNTSQALRRLTHLIAEGKEPSLILWSIAHELRMLANMSVSLQRGESYEAIFQKHRIFSRREKATRHFLKTHSTEDCWRYLLEAENIDQIIKGGKPGNIQEALQLFCLKWASS